MAAAGFFYTVLIFAICFVIVSVIKLARMGVESTKMPTAEEEKKQHKAEKPKPVYYIVEKRRTRKSYSEPREITFTDDKRR